MSKDEGFKSFPARQRKKAYSNCGGDRPGVEAYKEQQTLSTTPKPLQDILSNHCPMRNQQGWLSRGIRWVDCLHTETRVRKNKGCEEDTQEIHHGPRSLFWFNALSHTSLAAASLFLCDWNFSGKASDHTHQSGSPHSGGGNSVHLPTLSFKLEYKVSLQKARRLKVKPSASGTVENCWVLIS